LPKLDRLTSCRNGNKSVLACPKNSVEAPLTSLDSCPADV
jgi:hypothetical protein